MPNDESEFVRRARAAAERAMKSIPPETWDVARRAGEIVQSLTRPVLEVVEAVRSPEMQDLIRRAQEAFSRLPAALRNTVYTLGMNGWYPDDDMDMAQLVDYANAFHAGEGDKANDTLCGHFETRSETIISDLIAAAPMREKPLRRALEAHHEEKYELSIPVFLSQADGMWQDFTKADRETRLYSRKKGQPKTAKWVQSVKRDDLDEALLYPLVAPLPISAQDGEAVPQGALVRHRVLHGTDPHYATRLNSCRALSHLGYVGSVIRQRIPTGSNSTP